MRLSIRFRRRICYLLGWFADNVSIGDYTMDLQGIRANKWGGERGDPDKYGIPLRSFVLKGYDNVLMGGKNVGASAMPTVVCYSTEYKHNSRIGVLLGELRGTSVANVPAKEMEHVHCNGGLQKSCKSLMRARLILRHTRTKNNERKPAFAVFRIALLKACPRTCVCYRGWLILGENITNW